MKKGVIAAVLLGILLISPLIFAQNEDGSENGAEAGEETEAQIYSGFNRFIDNVRMFFTSGDNKVQVALEIREKELNSALANQRNGDSEEAERNLERARERLQFIQTKVSKDIAENVRMNVNETLNRIDGEGNLTEIFEVYVLEEKKTQLVAEIVIEFEGKEGQTLTREIVRNETTGRNEVEITIDGDNGEKVWEIEGEIGEVDNQIAEHVVVTDVAGRSSGSGGGLSPEVRTGTGESEDKGLAEPDLNQVNPDLYDPNARAPGDTIDETYDDDTLTVDEGENTLAP